MTTRTLPPGASFITIDNSVKPKEFNNLQHMPNTVHVPGYDPSIFKFPEVHYKKDPTRTMKALEWQGKESVLVVDRPRPMITESTDAIIRVTSTTICGSDLHLFHNEIMGMEKGDVMGHEFMGIVEEIGPEVTNLKVGDRVVVSFLICEGKCPYCALELYSCCDWTNPSKEMEETYGHRTAGLFGYSHLTGGYEGGQAEFVRVPYADMNTLVIPPNLRDEQVLFLSDIACTGYHATELGEVSADQVVAVWGCGPVGLMSIYWSFFRGAKRVIAIDCVPYRLEMAKRLGADTINFSEQNVLFTLPKMCPNGPDVAIDAVGFRFPKGLIHMFERALKLETDAPSVLNECITLVRKGGIVSVVGDYYQLANHFPIGAFMEKGLTMRGGQTWVQRYWKQLLKWIADGKVDLTWAITHTMPLEDAAKAYEMFDKKQDDAIKIVLKPSMNV